MYTLPQRRIILLETGFQLLEILPNSGSAFNISSRVGKDSCAGWLSHPWMSHPDKSACFVKYLIVGIIVKSQVGRIKGEQTCLEQKKIFVGKQTYTFADIFVWSKPGMSINCTSILIILLCLLP